MLFSKALEIELTIVCGTMNVYRSINFELITAMKICYFKGRGFLYVSLLHRLAEVHILLQGFFVVFKTVFLSLLAGV